MPASNSIYFISFLFIIFGSYAIISPQGISLENLKKSYEVTDLIRGWGIYAITIGLLLFWKDAYLKSSLIICFIASILWHLSIINRIGNTAHHMHSIIINGIVLLVIVNYYS